MRNISQTIKDFKEAEIPVAGAIPTKEFTRALEFSMQISKNGVFNLFRRIRGDIIGKDES